jgi:SAD/SRA domain
LRETELRISLKWVEIRSHACAKHPERIVLGQVVTVFIPFNVSLSDSHILVTVNGNHRIPTTESFWRDSHSKTTSNLTVSSPFLVLFKHFSLRRNRPTARFVDRLRTFLLGPSGLISEFALLFCGLISHHFSYDCHNDGVHARLMNGILGNVQHAAYSVVLSGYADNCDKGNTLYAMSSVLIKRYARRIPYDVCGYP